MRDFKVGDIVKVKNWGGSYTTCNDWFTRHQDELPFEWVVRFAYGNEQFFKYYDADSDDNAYIILHLSEERALITRNSRWEQDVQPVYLIDTNALKFPKTYTFSMSEAIRRLEDLCGGPVIIVGGDGHERD